MSLLNISSSNKDPIAKAYPKLSKFQENILIEAYNKKQGGLSLPMGTGKTFISLLLSIMLKTNDSIHKNPILVVVSKSILSEWIRELVKFFDKEINFVVLHNEYIPDIDNWSPFSSENSSKDCDVVLTTPQVLAKFYVDYNIDNKFTYYTNSDSFGPKIKNYIYADKPLYNYNFGPGLLYSLTWSVIIVDEAHMYSNIKTNRCLAIASICAEFRWLLSGTLFDEPKINKIFGYYLLLNHKPFPRTLPACKELVTNKESTFKGTIGTLVYRKSNDDYDLDNISTNVNKNIISHSLSLEESKIYSNIKSVINSLKNKLDEYKKNGNKDQIKIFSSYVVAMISYLRQCLICPIIPITSVAIKIADANCKSELCQIFMDNINSLKIDKWLNDANSICSSRIQSVIQHINHHPYQRIVIFSCYRSVIDVISYYIGNYRTQFTISGNHKIQQRESIVNDFSKSADGILLVTYEIGSNGLNLQCSDTIMLVDFWWNSGKTDQAICRILRRGQTSNLINIYYFTANTGMENALFKIQASKKKVANELLNGHIESDIDKVRTADIIKLINTKDNIDILTSISNT